MRLGRPREFDADQALQGAMALFWRQGYKATNLPDLLQAMGLTRGSFYKAFGDKQGAYLAALARYDAQVISRAVAMLGNCRGGTASECLSMLFAADDDARHGCFLCNAIVELAADDPKVAEKATAMTGRLRGAIRDVLDRHRATDAPDRTADLILHLYFGYRALGRAGEGGGDWEGHLRWLLR